MPRHRDRLDDIIRAAFRVFMAKGYQRTQMADVARELGVSPGTLYNYVASKEALFHVLIDRAFLREAAPPPPVLPVPTPPPGATLERLRERLTADSVIPALEAALTRRRVTDARAELERIVRDLYALIERNRQAITLIERSALELPDLARLFYGTTRRELVARLTRYLEARTRRGHMRPLPDCGAAARLILEAAAWFAMHRYRDPDASTIPGEVARETVVHFIVRALVPDGPQRARSHKEVHK